MEFREKIKKVLTRLQSLEGVEGCLVAMRNGSVLESLMPHDINVSRLAAMSASMLGAAEVAAETVKRGIARHLSLEIEGGVITIIGAGSKAFLLVLSSKTAAPNLVKALEEACKSVAEALT
ncbi:MAG: roadblock/LC7 domain-containing protein [Candidatus Jordarchaeales archaeon]